MPTDIVELARSISCTHPEALEWLHEAVRGMMPPVFCVEVGSWRGGSAIVLADAVRRAGGGQVLCVDNWSVTDGKDGPHPVPGSVRDDFMRNITAWPEIVWDESGSPDAAASVDRPVDMLWLDGKHTYDALWADLCAWVLKVRRESDGGGVIVGHDYGGEPGVGRAVREFFGGRVLAGPGDIWISTARF
mgnify:CR=1 FL=1